jgi:hypothetical protein
MAHRNNWGGFLPLLGLTLISTCTSPQVPTGSGIYYVAPVVSYLRECPGYDCKVIDELSQGDAVTSEGSKTRLDAVTEGAGNIINPFCI